MIAFYVILLSCASAVLYRLGGIGKPFNTKYRDFGVPLCALGTYAIIGPILPWWAYILTFGAMFGSMTTYCKFGNQEDVYWYNWLATGLLYGVSALPIALVTGKWVGFFIRTAVLGFTIMWWSEKMNQDFVEEGGRGFLFTITAPLLLI